MTPRILFLPPFFGFPSHFIPLVKLYQKLAEAKFEVAFVLPRLSPEDMTALRPHGFNAQATYYYTESFLSHFDLPVLDLKQQFSTIAELYAYRHFSPDLLIDDSNLITGIVRQISWVPRITIARAGIYGENTTHARHRHSLDPMVATLRRGPVEPTSPNSIEKYFEAEAHVIPASPSLEPMPRSPDHGARAFYCGPLILSKDEERFLGSAQLAAFFAKNEGRRMVYVTFGIDASRNPHSNVWRCLAELLRRDFAVVTNMSPPLEEDALQRSLYDQYLFSAVLPMHKVCSRVHLVIHVCGSATYHYPILHLRPSITIGTLCRDREDVAQRLHARGLSLHLPEPVETDGFTRTFEDALDLYEAGTYPFDAAQSSRLEAARVEIEAAAGQFNIGTVIEAALERGPPAGVRRPCVAPKRSIQHGRT